MSINREKSDFHNDPIGVPRLAAVGSVLVYGLVVMEFFYMASPFAAYFYSAYGPGLDWFGQSELTAWATQFELPHIVSQTTSWVVNAHTAIGLIPLMIGMSVFVSAAYKVYRHKFTVDKVLQSGLYAHIRHPQYACLTVASFGTLFIWPRMLAVLGFALVVVLCKASTSFCKR